MTSNPIDYRTALEIVSHEAIVREAYKDSVGTWTFSVGLTSASGHDVTRYIDNPQPMERCLEIFVWALEKYAQDVREAFHGHQLTQAQFAGALSFHWNTGAIKRASWVRHWKNSNVEQAKSSFMAWRKPPEIISRRQKERDLFFNGKWSASGKITEFAVKPNHTPDWGSAKRVNIERDLKAALRVPTRQPDDPGPEPTEPTRGPGWIIGLILLAFILTALFFTFT